MASISVGIKDLVWLRFGAVRCTRESYRYVYYLCHTQCCGSGSSRILNILKVWCIRIGMESRFNGVPVSGSEFGIRIQEDKNDIKIEKS
jgi:hypothetical protein